MYDVIVLKAGYSIDEGQGML